MSDINEYLKKMKALYLSDPSKAVRSQEFINVLHDFIEEELNERLSDKAKNDGIRVVREARLFGSFKSKDVDLTVLHPENGPLITVGVRSQMSSVGKNALTYYQDIIGECVSLQERFPMTTMGYVYLHPLVEPIADQKRPDHQRYARLYAKIGSRDDQLYKYQIGSYDQFAYVIVDFEDLSIHDEIVEEASPDVDLRLETFFDRIIETFKSRNVWLEDYFI